MTIYITKYALTSGIITIQDDIIGPFGQYSLGFTIGTYNHIAFKGQWHGTKKEAIEKAELMRSKAIDSIKKKLAKIERLNFNDVSTPATQL